MESKELSQELIFVAGSFGMLLLTVAIVMFIYLYQRKLIKKKIAYQKIEDLLKRQELKSAYNLLEGQDLERQRIAEELHDNLGSLLTTLTMYADTFLRESKGSSHLHHAESISKIARQSIEEVRKLSHQLDSASLKHFGFQSALKDLIDVVNNSQAIHIRHAIDFSDELDKVKSINLYRIIQELINNTLKHARATEIEINITQVKNEYLSVIYEDNGIGIQPSANGAVGMGMQNIITRAEKMNGHLIINTKGKTGFAMNLEIPLL